MSLVLCPRPQQAGCAHRRYCHRRRATSSPLPGAQDVYRGVHWALVTASRSSASVASGATPSSTAASATASAISRAASRMLASGGSSGVAPSVPARTAQSPTARAAATIMRSVTRLARQAVTARPTAGKT